eukprot:2440658-Prorocentrum_lima.AAC.1
MVLPPQLAATTLGRPRYNLDAADEYFAARLACPGYHAYNSDWTHNPEIRVAPQLDVRSPI